MTSRWTEREVCVFWRAFLGSNIQLLSKFQHNPVEWGDTTGHITRAASILQIPLLCVQYNN